MILRLLLLALLSPVLFVASAVAWFPAVAWHAVVPPTASGLMAYRVAEAAAAGARLRPRHEWVPIESMPVSLFRSVLVAEDTRFYEHHGFDVEQIREAWRSNRRGGALRGASTITQQTAKNLYLSPSRNVLRKGREALLAAWLEICQSKDRILESYLNVVELGPGIFGVGAASRVYFERAPADLSREQAALLAATLPAPLLRNPGATTAALRGRQRMILSRMGRWYEGPSLAEEEAALDSTPEEAPVVVPAEPLEFEVPPSDGTTEAEGDVGAPLEDALPEASPSPDDSATPPVSP
jgi:monofunctional biosynthetic peptidoglycan transglycosylase